MKKLFSLFAVMMLAIGGLVGCEPAADNDAADDAAPAVEETAPADDAAAPAVE